MSVFRALERELREAWDAALEPERIHVTVHAIRGSAVTVVAALDHDSGARYVREIRVHPEDWRELLLETDELGRYVVTAAALEELLGLPVIGLS